LKAHINDPLGPFDSPAIISVRSRSMLDVLVEAGADINAKSQWWAGGFGLLHGANPDVAAYAIERGAIVDAHAAARLGMFTRLQELISHDPTLVHSRGGDGQTPLHFASTIPIAAYLLDHGARIDERDIDHESTPAQWMVGDRQEICRFLVERGCSTDILLASALGNVALVQKHLDADASCIRMRVSQDYFPMINNKAGGTIYQWTLGFFVSAHQVARKFGHEPVLQLLFEHSPTALKLIESCWLKDEVAVKALRKNYPDYSATLTDADRRQVADAARNNEAEAVRLLLESGLPIDSKGQHQATPLHWAAFHGNIAMAKIILRYGPPLEATDADFHGTPLGWAIHGSENGWNSSTGDYAGTVETLTQAGAKLPAEIRGSQAVREVLARHMVI
jgi:Ankyrin repeats (3 copies)/Ankyrin repeat